MEALLNDNPGLRPFLLLNVKFTRRPIGAGAYGNVEEVEIAGAVCAAKYIHDFFREAPLDSLGRALNQFVRECQLISRLRHPNIVQFLGVCVVPGSRLPALVMERLVTSLHEMLEPETKSPQPPPPPPSATKLFFPLCLKCSILYDVASGLTYLHEQSPPVIHRDLSARNILLNSGMVAKIADLGVARILPHCGLHVATTMSKAPGASVYMPPEAVEQKSDSSEDREKSKYDASIDVFAFGVVSLFTLTQMFPCDLLGPNYRDKEKNNTLFGRSEVERRQKYMTILYEKLSETHQLVVMIIKCLDFPEQRPGIKEVLQVVQGARAETRYEMMNMNKLELMQALHSQQTKAPEEDVDASEKEITEKRTQLETSEQEKPKIATDEKNAQLERLLIQEKEKKIEWLGSLVKELKTKVDNQEASISTLQEEKKDLASEIFTANVVIDRLEVVEIESDKRKRIIIKQNEEIATLQKEKEKLALSAKSNGDKVKAMDKEKERLTRRIAELNEKTVILQNDLGAVQAMAKIYEDDFNIERRDREKAMGKLELLQREAAQGENRVKHLQTQLLTASSEKYELEDRLRQVSKELESHVEYYRKLVEEYQRELDRYHQMSEARQRRVVEEMRPSQPTEDNDIAYHHSQSEPGFRHQYLGVPDEAGGRAEEDHTYVNVEPQLAMRPSPSRYRQRYSVGDIPNSFYAPPQHPPAHQSPVREYQGSSQHPQIVISEEEEEKQNITEDRDTRY